MPTITENIVPIQAKIPERVAQKIRMAAASRGVPARDILIEAVDEYFKRHPLELPEESHKAARRAS